MLTAFLVTLIVLRMSELRRRLYNATRPLRNNKQYQVQEALSVFSVKTKEGKTKRMFPSTSTCIVVTYDCLHKTSKGQPFRLYDVYFREIPRTGVVYTARRKKKFARIFFEEKREALTT